MKYSILINQIGITQHKLENKTDLVDWAIIDYLRGWYFAERVRYFAERKQTAFQEYVEVNYKQLTKEMPLLKIKDKHVLTNRLQKLEKLGLIETFQTKDNSLYFALTPFCVQVIGEEV